MNEFNITTAEVKDYYEYTGRLFSMAWGNNWHFGYWPDNERKLSLAEAQERLTNLLLDKFRVGEGDHVLDIGCGVGWPAITMARSKKCKVTGVTISDYQIAEADRLAVQEHMADSVSFSYGDGMDLPFPDHSFDGVWAVESLCNMQNTGKALSEIYRVLKPGGTAVITDVYSIIPLRPEHLKAMGYVFVISSIHSFAEYKELVEKAGFTIGEFTDISKNIRQTTIRLASAIENKVDEIVKIYGSAIDEVMQKEWRRLVGGFKRCGYFYTILRK